MKMTNIACDNCKKSLGANEKYYNVRPLTTPKEYSLNYVIPFCSDGIFHDMHRVDVDLCEECFRGGKWSG